MLKMFYIFIMAMVSLFMNGEASKFEEAWKMIYAVRSNMDLKHRKRIRKAVLFINKSQHRKGAKAKWSKGSENNKDIHDVFFKICNSILEEANEYKEELQNSMCSLWDASICDTLVPMIPSFMKGKYGQWREGWNHDNDTVQLWKKFLNELVSKNLIVANNELQLMKLNMSGVSNEQYLKYIDEYQDRFIYGIHNKICKVVEKFEALDIFGTEMERNDEGGKPKTHPFQYVWPHRHSYTPTMHKFGKGWGFANQGSQILCFDEEALKHTREYIKKRVMLSFEEHVKDEDRDITWSKNLVNNLKAHNLTEDVIDMELNKLIKNIVPYGQMGQDSRWRGIMNYTFLCNIGNKVLRSCLACKVLRTSLVVAEAEDALASLIGAKGATWAIRRKEASKYAKEHKDDAFPEVPTKCNKVAFNNYAEQVHIWRLVKELNSKSIWWTVVIEVDAHASFAGLYGASLHIEDYLNRTNCLNQHRDSKVNAFYSFEDIDSPLPNSIRKALGKAILITLHYGRNYKGTTAGTQEVTNDLIWSAYTAAEGQYLPKGFTTSLVPNPDEGLYQVAVEKKHGIIIPNEYGNMCLDYGHKVVAKAMTSPAYHLIEEICKSKDIKQTATIDLLFNDGDGVIDTIKCQTKHTISMFDEVEGKTAPVRTKRGDKFPMMAAAFISNDAKISTVNVGDRILYGFEKLYADRLATWLPTGFIHHYDAVAADYISATLIKRGKFCITIHDAFLVAPGSYQLIATCYDKILTYLWEKGPTLWANYLISAGLDGIHIIRKVLGETIGKSMPNIHNHTFK